MSEKSLEKTVKIYRDRLKYISKEALPKVVADSVTAVAKRAHEQSIVNILSRYTIRNRYTVGSVRFYKASPKRDIMKINAISGSVSDYMDEQDLGGKRLPKSGEKVPEATLFARGGSKESVVKKKNRTGFLGKNQFIGVPKGIAKNRPYGVYERVKNNKFLSMVRNISKVSIDIKGTSWHRDAMSDQKLVEIMQKEFIDQARLYIEKGI